MFLIWWPFLNLKPTLIFIYIGRAIRCIFFIPVLLPIFSYLQVKVTPLRWDEKFYLPQETGNYSVAGFKLNMERKMTHYLITYYLPSGLFVVVSWASFLIPSDDIQVINIFSCIFKHLFMQLSHHVIKSVIIHICQNMLSKQIDFTVIDHNMEDCLLAGLAI